MIKLEILLIGKDPTFLDTTLKQLNENKKWDAWGTTSDEEAIELFHKHHFDLIVFTENLQEEAEKKMRSIFSFHHPELTILQIQPTENLSIKDQIQKYLDTQRREKWKNIFVKDHFLGPN